MFGLADPVISAAYILNFLAVVISVIYGAMNWNKGGDVLPEDLDRQWRKEEQEIEKEFE